MGYYTLYQIDIEGMDSNILDSIMENKRLNNEIIGDIYDQPDCIKWYDHEKEIIQFSREYPELFITLYGEGEQWTEDTWRKYFQNGKMQYCPATIVYPDFDPNKMEEFTKE